MTAHAKNRPPSAAHRWLSCPASPAIVQQYPNEPSEASIKGDAAHVLLDNALQFGVVPNHPDVDLVYSVMYALEMINDRVKAYGGPTKCKVYAEQQLDIPETGEFGTSDAILVSDTHMEVIDYKNGYVPVDVYLNPQLLLYLLGAIAKYGERKNYRISLIQPNYVHTDGKFRGMDITEDQITWFRGEVNYAMLHDHYAAGKHCKTSYCPHRGACATFQAWSLENLDKAWFPSEVNAMTDEQLADTLEQAEVLQGYRDALRGEALRRILHQDRTIPGYKIVRSRKDRAFADDNAQQTAFNALVAEGVPMDALYDKSPVSVAGVERIIKGLYKPNGRHAWQDAYDRIVPPTALAPLNQSLTLEKAIDGRRAYKRGSEFGAILPPATPVVATPATTNTTPTSDTTDFSNISIL